MIRASRLGLVHLVRHGETVGESAVRYWGRTDLALSEVGRAQVRGLAAALPAPRVDVVVHSPLRRAVESAQILIEHWQLGQAAVRVEPGFGEVDFGDFEGLTRDEIAARDPAWFATWERGEHVGFPGGDTLAAFSARVGAAFERVQTELAGDLLVVVHRGVIRQIANALVPGAGDQPTHLASLSTLDVPDARVVRWNERGDENADPRPR
ncbi:MAG: histidine phosphatase family protein [Planctomycetota bacterium]